MIYKSKDRYARGDSMGVAGPWGNNVPASPSQDIMEKVWAIQHYCKVMGWEVVQYNIPKGNDYIIDDPSVAVLMVTPIGEPVDGYGIRASETELYVIRKPAI